MDNFSAENTTELAERTRNRITRRLMPFLICLFIVAFIDRVNLGFAKLEMTEELGFNAEMIGFGAGIFFIGYFLFEIPGSILVETWSARKWLARIIISWGIIATLDGFYPKLDAFLHRPFLARRGGSRIFSGRDRLSEPLVSLSGQSKSGRAVYGGNSRG